MAVIMMFLSGIIFAIGLGISGMTQPEKVTGFLNIAGDWDPSLAFVMLGATMTYLIGNFAVLKRKSPVLGETFILPSRTDIDRPLVVGSVLFGLGWGLVGFCPGPALVALVTGYDSVIIFVLAMGVGMYAFEVLETRFAMEPDGGVGIVVRH